MNLILHIGQGKTGTTSIQNYLWKNKEILSTNKILYEEIPNSRNHCWIVVPLGGPVRSDKKEAKANVLEWINIVKEKIKHNRPDHLIISAETLYNFKGIEKFQDLIYDAFNPDSIDLICYLRRTDSFYLSTIQQQLKASYEFDSPINVKGKFIHHLNRWTSIKNLKKLHLKNFDRKYLEKGCAVCDFMKIIESITGFDLSPTKAIESDNATMSAEEMIIMQHYRYKYFHGKNGTQIERSNKLLNDLVQYRKHLNHTKPKLSSIYSYTILKNSSSEYREFRDKYIANETSRWKNWDIAYGFTNNSLSELFQARNSPSLVELLSSFKIDTVLEIMENLKIK